MRVLITGGTGFIGMSLAEELTDEAIDVVLMARRPLHPEMEKSLTGRKGSYAYFKGNVLDGDSFDQVIGQYDIDAIVHAAVITPGEDREREQSRLIATERSEAAGKTTAASRIGAKDRCSAWCCRPRPREGYRLRVHLGDLAHVP
ncbi:MAG: NAD-dependent epimerase/dehydratase family protein [Spirochaetota bacterium]|nr:NAD-dependent epimerase/dehydratase family protein [Spirochaetota bacterium]